MTKLVGRPITLICFGLIAMNVVMAGYYRASGEDINATWCIIGAVVLAAAMTLLEMFFGGHAGDGRD